MGERQGWRAPFVVLGLAGLVYAVVLVRGIRSGSKRSEARLGASIGEVLLVPGYGGMLMAFTAFAIANWVVYTWLPLYLFERFQVSLASAGFSATFYLQA